MEKVFKTKGPTKRRLFLTEKQLENPTKVLSELNRVGWNLGSGHEKIEVSKIDSRNYVFTGITYYGAPTQKVYFQRYYKLV